MYATLACLVFMERGEVEYSLAGHPPIVRYRAATGEFERYSMNQFPLGLMSESRYESARVSWEPGDLFVLVSNGILEAAEPTGVEFGLDGVEEVLRECIKMPLKDITSALFERLKSFGPLADDHSTLLIRFRPASGAI